MNKSVLLLKNGFTKIRTGRAHTSLLDHITVEYYGSQVPLNQVANINVEDSRTLKVSPWEKEMVQIIEKVIVDSDLGLNPTTAGTIIRIPLPALTEERRIDRSPSSWVELRHLKKMKLRAKDKINEVKSKLFA